MQSELRRFNSGQFCRTTRRAIFGFRAYWLAYMPLGGRGSGFDSRPGHLTPRKLNGRARKIQQADTAREQVRDYGAAYMLLRRSSVVEQPPQAAVVGSTPIIAAIG
jgi:hypothetical protein